MSKPKIQFQIVLNAVHTKFEKDVNLALADGWQFHGGIFLLDGCPNNPGYTYICQAFVKGATPPTGTPGAEGEPK